MYKMCTLGYLLIATPKIRIWICFGYGSVSYIANLYVQVPLDVSRTRGQMWTKMRRADILARIGLRKSTQGIPNTTGRTL